MFIWDWFTDVLGYLGNYIHINTFHTTKVQHNSTDRKNGTADAFRSTTKNFLFIKIATTVCCDRVHTKQKNVFEKID